MTLYLVLGPPSSGKTTYCRRKTRSAHAYWVTCDLFTESDFEDMSIDEKQYHIYHMVNYICEAALLGKDVYVDAHLYLLKGVLPLISAKRVFSKIKIMLLTSGPKESEARHRYAINGGSFSGQIFERYHRYIMDEVIFNSMMLYGYSLSKEHSIGRVRIYDLRSF